MVEKPGCWSLPAAAQSVGPSPGVKELGNHSMAVCPLRNGSLMLSSLMGALSQSYHCTFFNRPKKCKCFIFVNLHLFIFQQLKSGFKNKLQHMMSPGINKVSSFKFYKTLKKIYLITTLLCSFFLNLLVYILRVNFILLLSLMTVNQM